MDDVDNHDLNTAELLSAEITYWYNLSLSLLSLVMSLIPIVTNQYSDGGPAVMEWG